MYACTKFTEKKRHFYHIIFVVTNVTILLKNNTRYIRSTGRELALKNNRCITHVTVYDRSVSIARNVEKPSKSEKTIL